MADVAACSSEEGCVDDADASGKRCVRYGRDGGMSRRRRSEEETTDEGGVSMHTCRKPSFL